MPCNSDYMAPYEWELEIVESAKVLVYVIGQLRPDIGPHFPSKWLGELVTKGIIPNYSVVSRESGDWIVSTLCGIIRKLSKAQRERLIYSNSKDKEQRRLADWWEAHRKADAERLREEREIAKKNKVKWSALNKLTAKEREALGYD